MELLGTMMSIQSVSAKMDPIKYKMQKVKSGTNLNLEKPRSRNEKPIQEKDVQYGWIQALEYK